MGVWERGLTDPSVAEEDSLIAINCKLLHFETGLR